MLIFFSGISCFSQPLLSMEVVSLFGPSGDNYSLLSLTSRGQHWRKARHQVQRSRSNSQHECSSRFSITLCVCFTQLPRCNTLAVAHHWQSVWTVCVTDIVNFPGKSGIIKVDFARSIETKVTRLLLGRSHIENQISVTVCCFLVMLVLSFFGDLQMKLACISIRNVPK